MTTPRLAAVALVWAGAACAVSQQQEVQLGAETAAQVEQQLPLVRDAQVNSYITSLGRSLARVADTRGLTWHFKVVDSKEVNAFAIPGGWVYVNRGLIERAQNMSQLAGVLGHEIAHVPPVFHQTSADGAGVGGSGVAQPDDAAETVRIGGGGAGWSAVT